MKWIKISEVKKNELVEWFRVMKKRSYILVGLEQTTNSVQIQDYVFDSVKTALVLGEKTYLVFYEKTFFYSGNEREGIPVELIPYFDAVCEIPQRNRLKHTITPHD